MSFHQLCLPPSVTGAPTQTAEFVALPLADRLLAMEALWDSLCRDQTLANTVPAWHEEELSNRLDAMDAGQQVVSPWDEAKQRIRQHAEQLIRPGQCCHRSRRA